MTYNERLASSGTHGLLDLPTCQVHGNSKGSDWDSIYVSYQTEKPFSFAAKARPHCLFVLHLTGPVDVTSRYDGRLQSFPVPIGAVTYWPPNHDFEVTTHGTLKTLHVYLEAALVDVLSEQFGHSNLRATSMPPIFAETDELLKSLLIEAWHSADGFIHRTDLYAEQLAQTIASRLIRRNVPSGQRAGSVGALAPRDLKRVAEFIMDRIASRISIRELADIVGYSQSHFSRSFSLATGTSPYRHVIDKRIELSKNLLQFSEEPIVSIALSCGFADQEHFTRTFRKLVGSTPLSFRRQTRM